GNKALGENGQGGGGGGAGLGAGIFNDGVLRATNCTFTRNLGVAGNGSTGTAGKGGGPNDTEGPWPLFGTGGRGAHYYEFPARPPITDASPGGDGGFGGGGGSGAYVFNFVVSWTSPGGLGGYGGGRGKPDAQLFGEGIPRGSGGGGAMGGAGLPRPPP